MHSSRMRNVRCSGCGGCIPACTGQGVSTQGYLPRGCLPGGCLTSKVSAKRVSVQEVSTTHTPVNRITDACENITLLQLRCGW